MSRRQTSHLSAVHSRILDAVVRIADKRGYVTVAELVDCLDLAGVTSLTATLRIMQRNGFITIHGGGIRGQRRTITLTTQAKAALGVGVLRLLGGIPAGPLAEVLNECETVVDCTELLPHKLGDFLLVVEGDSMIGDGILPGDRALLRPNITVRDGEIAAVHVGDEYLATLKHVHFGPGKANITLRASNRSYKDVVVPAKQVTVAGVYKGLIRIR